MLTGAVALAIAFTASAATGDEQALAEKYSPVVRLVEQPVECGPGEPYIPLDVDLLLDQPTVALRGPWNTTDLVKIGPSAQNLVNRYEYHLDFPGSALSPGCDYENWQRHLLASGGSPTVYAHVATDPAHPGKLALQYWFFYVFNDFNNTHEGDWEMIQLDFDAADAAAALNTEPTAIGYSSHEGAERADWGDQKLELVDGTHPVVYPAAGSHANKFGAALYLGSSADAGVGCDDTLGPHNEIRPVVKTIPSDPAAAAKAYPWITFEGRWGELQPAFYNGPTGPNLKPQWTEPITWSDGWRSRSYAVPTGGIFGTGATDFFCGGVEKGSAALTALIREPTTTLITIGILLVLLVWLVRRTTWRPGVPLRLAHRRTWGRILSSAARMYASRRAGLFVGIGVIFIPLGIVISLVQALVLGGFGLLGVDTSGEGAGALVLLVVTLGTTLALLGFGLVQAATAKALVEIDRGNEIGPVHAYRLALTRFRPLFRTLLIGVGAWVVLTATVFLSPDRDLARGAVGVSRAGRGARGRICARSPAPERAPRPWALAPRRVARRDRPRARARDRPAHRRPADHLHPRAVRLAERRGRNRLCARDAVRRDHHHVPLLRREGAQRARAAGGARGPARRDRARGGLETVAVQVKMLTARAITRPRIAIEMNA